MDKNKVIALFKKQYKNARSTLSAQYDNTKACQQFYTGDASVYQDYMQYSLPNGKKQRAMVRFNKIMPFVDAVVGFAAQNRRNIKYLARIDSSVRQKLYSKQMNAIKDYVREQCHADHLESEQDQDMFVCGYGAVETDMSYVTGNASTTPNGEIIMCKIEPDRVYWDGRARRKNLADARYCGYWNEYDIYDALDLFSGSNEGDFEPVSADEDKTYYYAPYGGRFSMETMYEAVEWADQSEQRVKVYNHQWFEYESYWQCDNPAMAMQNPEAQQLAMQTLMMIGEEAKNSGDLYYQETDPFAFNPAAERLTMTPEIKKKVVKQFGSFVTPVEFKRKKFYTAVLSGSHVFTCFESVSQNDFSIQFKTGTYDPIRKIWIGIVNNMMEPQRYYNKALTELIFTIASNSKGGVLVEKSAVEDIQQFNKKYASTDSVIVVRDGAISGNKIMPKGQPVPATGLERIIQLSDASIADGAGIDKAFLGSQENKMETGILYRRRIRQVVSTMAKYFDAITMYQKTNARVLLDFMRVWAENNNGAEIELREDNGEQTTSVIDSEKFLVQYGITIQEASQSPEDKQETGEVLSSFADKFLAAGDPATAKAIYTTSVKYLNLDPQDEQKLMEALQPQQQQVDPAYVQQLEQQVQLLTSETNRADVEQKMSVAQLNRMKIRQVEADAMNKDADTTRTLEEANQKSVETAIMTSNANSATVTI